MLNDFIDRVQSDLQQLINQGGRNPPEPLRPLLEKAIADFGLVTYEEYQAQAKVLSRTRERLEALEERLKVLEGQAES